MRYAMIDADGLVVSAHNDLTIKELPAGAAPLTEQEWENRFSLKWTGNQWEQLPPPPAPADEVESE